MRHSVNLARRHRQRAASPHSACETARVPGYVLQDIDLCRSDLVARLPGQSR